MKKCYIITSYVEGDLSEIIKPEKADFIICADGGYDIAVSAGLTPNLVIGDSDSCEMPAPGCGVEVMHFPREKDESDTFLCVKHAVKLGFKDIIIAGGIGGRLDHTISNIQTLAYFSDLPVSILLLDENNIVSVIESSGITLNKIDGAAISLFSLSDKCTGVSTEGLRYPLKGAELSSAYPLGLSNEFAGDTASIDVERGKLLIVISKINCCN